MRQLPDVFFSAMIEAAAGPTESCRTPLASDPAPVLCRSFRVSLRPARPPAHRNLLATHYLARMSVFDPSGLKNFAADATRLEPGAVLSVRYAHSRQDNSFACDGTILTTSQGEIALAHRRVRRS